MDWVLFAVGSSELEGLEEKDKALAHALIERGETLMTGGARSGERKYLRMALVDFLQAYELEPDNRRLLADLAQILRKAGQHGKGGRVSRQMAGSRRVRE